MLYSLELGRLLAQKSTNLDPKKHKDEVFELYSIGAYDIGKPEILTGKEIGSSKKVLKENDVILSRIVPHIRRCWVVPKSNGTRQIGSGEWMIFRNNKTDSKYLRYFLISDPFNKMFMQTVKGVGGSLLRADPKQVARFQIPLPPLKTQQRIAAILDNAADLRDKTAHLLKEYDLLARSIFLEIFGDPVKNPKNFKTESLSNYGSFKNGLNFNKSESGFKVKYLGVGDFKSKYKLEKMNKLSFINLSSLPSEDYFLKDGDLVFVRSNGNRQLVGRCIALFPKDERVTFSGFCIRYRLDNNNLKSIYLTHLFRNDSFKNAMLEGGRGANIQNINQQILGSLKIPIPKPTLQNQFAEKIALIEQQKELATQELKQSEDLFNGLLQKAFKGELVGEEVEDEVEVEVETGK